MMIADAANRNRPLYDFLAPVDLRTLAAEDGLFSELVATKAFQRLKTIRFLGGIDYLLVRAPNGVRGNIRYTRYQHSLGVARLGLLYSWHRDLALTSRRIVYVAALLHDVGHAPLSHSLEPVFREIFGLEHHGATRDIITGRVKLGQELYQILRRNQVDVERVLAVLDGNEGGFDGFFAGPINFDTIEGILRSQSYNKGTLTIPSPEGVMEAALLRRDQSDRIAVDNFWSHKDQVYRHVINSRSGVLADFACQVFMRSNLNQIVPEDYFTSEKQIFRKLPGLHRLLTSRSFETHVMRHLNRPISYKLRRFFIEPQGDFYARDDRQRYKQRRDDAVLSPRDVEDEAFTQLDRDLFDDDCNTSGEGTLGI